jgi:hypothetical protein
LRAEEEAEVARAALIADPAAAAFVAAADDGVLARDAMLTD